MGLEEEKTPIERINEVVSIDRNAVENELIKSEPKDLKVFTVEDEIKKFCCDCKYRGVCITLRDQNKMSMKRDGIPVDKIWGCTTFKEEDR